MTYLMRRAKGSSTPVKYPAFDSPAAHGWTVRRTDSDGVKIWELRENGEVLAVMKPDVTEWNTVNVALLPYGEDHPEWIEITGSYSEITKAVRRLYLLALEDDKIFSEAIHWNGEPEDCQPDPDSIPYDGRPMQYAEGVL